jgi:group I intron endonuclease
MERKWKIYKVTNTINGKIYVGKQTNNRKNYYGSGKLIKQAIQKYGIENFTKEIIDEVVGDVLGSEREIYWITKLKALDGYNLEIHGNGGEISERQRRMNSETVKKMWQDPNSIFNTPEYRNRLSNAGKKRVWSEETKKKISNGRIGKDNPAAIKIEVDGMIYETRRECAKHFNISEPAVTKRCLSKNFENWKLLNKKSL